MEEGIIIVTDRDGQSHELVAVQGWRVMELVRDQTQGNPALKIEALCGGCCSCASCHVYVRQDWFDRLPAALDEENERLDEAYDVQPNSRLSCQIIWDKTLDGLAITIAPEFN